MELGFEPTSLTQEPVVRFPPCFSTGLHHPLGDCWGSLEFECHNNWKAYNSGDSTPPKKWFQAPQTSGALPDKDVLGKHKLQLGLDLNSVSHLNTKYALHVKIFTNATSVLWKREINTLCLAWKLTISENPITKEAQFVVKRAIEQPLHSQRFHASFQTLSSVSSYSSAQILTH